MLKLRKLASISRSTRALSGQWKVIGSNPDRAGSEFRENEVSFGSPVEDHEVERHGNRPSLIQCSFFYQGS